MKRLYILCPLFFLLSASTPAVVDHAIYISVVEINCNSTTMKIKVFADDLRDVLRNYSDQYVRVPLSELAESNELLIDAYFNEKLEITINGEKIRTKLTGAKEENDAYFLLFSLEVRSDWKSMSIKGDYFAEVFADQSNVFTIECSGERLFARLTKTQPEQSFTFD
ncbi:MAG: hypothetical protein RIM99_06015 [Cyclobacteriaceae bacterium]